MWIIRRSDKSIFINLTFSRNKEIQWEYCIKVKQVWLRKLELLSRLLIQINTMPPWRRTLTVQESLRVAKFFYTLLEIQGGNILFKFYPKDEQVLRQNYIDYEMGQLQPTPPPFTKTLHLLEQTLVTIGSYLS